MQSDFDRYNSDPAVSGCVRGSYPDELPDPYGKIVVHVSSVSGGSTYINLYGISMHVAEYVARLGSRFQPNPKVKEATQS